MVTKPQVRSEIPIEGTRLLLTGIEVSQTIALTGSVTLSLERAFELTSNGELAVSATYKINAKTTVEDK